MADKSEALDRAMNEVDRIWSASDKFETKVLQFVGFVIAGAFAGAGAMLTKLQLEAPLPAVVTLLLVLGTIALLVFVVMALLSAIGNEFGAPINPQQLAEYPNWLEKDAEFRKDFLPAVVDAHKKSVATLSGQVRQFRHSLIALGIAVLLLVSACMICTLVPFKNKKGDSAAVTSEDPKKPEPTQKPATGPEGPVKPVPRPYVVTKEVPPISMPSGEGQTSPANSDTAKGS